MQRNDLINFLPFYPDYVYISWFYTQFHGSAFMLECNDKHDIEGNPLLQYSITA